MWSAWPCDTMRTSMTRRRSGRMAPAGAQARPARVQGRPARRPRRRTDSQRLETGWMAVRSANRRDRRRLCMTWRCHRSQDPTRTGEGWRNVRCREGRSGSLSSRLRSSPPRSAMAGPAREEDHGFTSGITTGRSSRRASPPRDQRTDRGLPALRRSDGYPAGPQTRPGRTATGTH
jgi:hypothetical protein